MELDLSDWIVEAFLVKRDPRKNVSIDEYFTVDQLNIDDQFKDNFQNIINGYLCDNDNNFVLKLEDFYEFMSDDSKEKKYKITKEELSRQNGYFDKLLSMISEEETEADVAGKDFSSYHFIILRFSKEGQEIFYGRKLKRVSVGKHKFSIFKGEIGEVEYDLIFFDEFVDFIFFKHILVNGDTDEERMRFKGYALIYSRKNFKTLLRLDEFNITKSREFFDTFDFIEVADIDTETKDSDGNVMKLKDTFIHDGSLNPQITRIALHKEEVTFDKIKTLKEQRGSIYRFQVSDNKVKIENKKQMKDLLDLIDEKIAAPDWEPNKVLRYPLKGEDIHT